MKKNSNVILCVDDEENILKSLARVLGHDYEVLTALGAQAALDVLEKKKADLVIVDERMPKMSGSELLKILKEKYPLMIRIMLSGFQDFAKLVKAINEGEIYRFISKPWNNDDLKATVALALEQQRVLNIVSELTKRVMRSAEGVEGVLIQTSQDVGCINMKIVDDGKIVSEEIVFKTLNLLFDSLGLEKIDELTAISGGLTKQKGKIVMVIDIGKGLNLRIEMPRF